MSMLRMPLDLGTIFFPRFHIEMESRTPSRFLLWMDRQRQRRQLAQLGDRLLDDIGVTRVAAQVENRWWD